MNTKSLKKFVKAVPGRVHSLGRRIKDRAKQRKQQARDTVDSIFSPYWAWRFARPSSGGVS